MTKKNSAINELANSADQGGRPVLPEEVYANQGLIKDVALRLGWDYDSGRDLVQEVALKCWNDPRVRFNPNKGSLAGYLARIARNTAVDMWRKNKRLVPMKDSDLTSKIEAAQPDVEEYALHEERRDLMDRGIKELSRRYPSKKANDAFLMFSYDGLSTKEVARKLWVEERFVGVAVHRGVERLTAIVKQLQKDDNWRDAS